MAREFKPITGKITKLNEPQFAEQRRVWVMMVKENDRWIAINSRDEAKIKAYHHQLQTQQAASNLNVRVQATSLEGTWLKAAEFAAGILQQAKVEDPTTMMTAVESHLKQQQDLQYVPKINEACDLFYAKQSKRQLSTHTMFDYSRLVRHLKERFGDRLTSSLTSSEMTAFIEELPHPVSQRARYIYLKSFLSFCSGKMNPFCEGRPWIKTGLLQWEPAKTDLHEVQVYSFDQIIRVLKVAQQHDRLPHFIFRLFGMLRYFEMIRFTEIHRRVRGHPLINLEQKRIIFGPEIFKKRSRNEHRGRFYANLHPTFMAWLDHFAENNQSIWCSVNLERKIRQQVEGRETDRNLLRHTAITYHCLAFKNPLQTAFIAGNSAAVIQNHYLNMNVPEADALKLYELTPDRARELGIL
ncbi:MAG: hypothetical protein RLZZ129_1112 [Verrucomicrobiota bacterium]|jgi:hypothetical protein